MCCRCFLGIYRNCICEGASGGFIMMLNCKFVYDFECEGLSRQTSSCEVFLICLVLKQHLKLGPSAWKIENLHGHFLVYLKAYVCAHIMYAVIFCMVKLLTFTLACNLCMLQ